MAGHARAQRRNRPVFTDSEGVVEFIASQHPDLMNSKEEFLALLFLDSSMHPTKMAVISRGTSDEVVASIPQLLSALHARSESDFFLLHNHPSGSATPSSADHELTQKVLKAIRCEDVRLRDHLILTPDKTQFFSFYASQMLEGVP
jgi:DNA repair protein RadC